MVDLYKRHHQYCDYGVQNTLLAKPRTSYSAESEERIFAMRNEIEDMVGEVASEPDPAPGADAGPDRAEPTLVDGYRPRPVGQWPAISNIEHRRRLFPGLCRLTGGRFDLRIADHPFSEPSGGESRFAKNPGPGQWARNDKCQERPPMSNKQRDKMSPKQRFGSLSPGGYPVFAVASSSPSSAGVWLSRPAFRFSFSR